RSNKARMIPAGHCRGSPQTREIRTTRNFSAITGSNFRRAKTRPRRNTMRKSIAYSLMLAATLGLAACDSSSENKAEDARESAADAQESMNDARDSMNDAARQSNEAAQERIEENRDNGLNNGGATGT